MDLDTVLEVWKMGTVLVFGVGLFMLLVMSIGIFAENVWNRATARSVLVMLAVTFLSFTWPFVVPALLGKAVAVTWRTAELPTIRDHRERKREREVEVLKERIKQLERDELGASYEG